MSNAEGLEAAADAIARTEELALACHVGPDGDALGSMLGLGIAARCAGKKVAASFGSPFVMPPNLGFMPSDLLVSPQDFPKAPELMVVLDAGSADRLGELEDNASKAVNVVVLDHHITNEGFGHISVVDATAAATGELVFDLLGLLEWPITPDVANCLYTALVTDTGRFLYSNTTSRTLEIAAQLLEFGADPTEIGRHVYEESRFGSLKVTAVALGRAELDESARFVSTIVTQADMTAAGIEWGDLDNLIDTLRLAKEADVAVLAKVQADGQVRVSMRSRGDTDVGSLAVAMGGGGHRLAAGFTTETDARVVIRKIREAIEEYR